MIQFFRQEWAAVATTFFALSLFTFRVFYFMGGPCTDGVHPLACPNIRFLFLVWNLYLAWIPLGIVYGLRYGPKKSWWLFGGAGIWLLFFPNAPYLITDFIHLRPHTGVPYWYDGLLFFVFAYLGLHLAGRSLRLLLPILQARWGKLWSASFVGLSLLLSGLGIYLGRVQRWNSWDVFHNPAGPLFDTWQLFVDPGQYVLDWLLIITFSVSISLSYSLQSKA